MRDEIKKRLVRNEQIIRLRNEAASKGIKKYFRSEKSVKITPVEFECECSDLKCKETVKMSIEKYENKHTLRNEFVVSPGHDIPQIENVVERKPGYALVNKPNLKS